MDQKFYTDKVLYYEETQLLLDDLQLFAELGHATIGREPMVAVDYSEFLAIVQNPLYAKKYFDADAGKNGRKKQPAWSAQIAADLTAVKIDVYGNFGHTYYLPTCLDVDMQKIKHEVHKIYQAKINATAADETPETAGNEFYVTTRGNASKFCFLMSDLYAVLKNAKTDEVLSFDNRVFFPVRPIRDMLKVCDKGHRWDAEIIPGTLGRYTLRITVTDSIKTIFNVQGSECQDVLTVHKGYENKRPYKEIRHTLKRSNAYIWVLPSSFFDSLMETAVITPEPAQDAPELTPEPDPVVMVTETAVITPEPAQPTPEPEKQPDPMPVMATTPAKPKQPRKRRQPAQKDNLWILFRDIVKIVFDEAKTAVIAR